MSKRFTDSEKFRDSWYRKLKPKHKCLWEYMLAECSVAGTLEIDYDSMKFHIGDNFTSKDLDIFKDRVFFLEDNLIFIPKFLQFQQPSGLSRTNKAHNNIYKLLEKYSIPETLDTQQIKSTFKGASEGLPSTPSNSISKGKGKGKGSYGEFKKVLLTEEEYSKLEEVYNDRLQEAIDVLDTYLASKGDSYKSHYPVFKKNGWLYKKVMGDKPKTKLPDIVVEDIFDRNA